MKEKNKIVLITGGVRSGKSEFAESLLQNEKRVLYIATAKITDKEMEHRVEKHKKRRNSAWKTYEGYKDLGKIIKDYDEKNILLDCVTVMTTNLMFHKEIDYENIKEEDLDRILESIKKEFYDLIISVNEENKNIILVTNEVGYSIVPAYKLGRIFRDFQGIINKFIASLSDEVYLVTCGIPLKIK
ncbi:bifunctional adenosylcobinamide kinase/adenosylcobinamide-phosphate guanylyltransferase [Clostridium botulinum]|uniref:bifunctional adenosylcobinamide kinase/adenosylcobinamide-phosphate guanylyltransferase n=1 Tax=Clostridium botulinum TaxID=1491 RepID=UPI001A928A88|nr:bifunctional adenosylcobinamide kinase/adenosylcobinamide-phosphate guanylyltransferase [Clostridium botulinum]EKO1912948.1 bifunctional adenosylcobinamide kinase/adenosylcobinamide-phosphate guanylyltransferase [Clostridium botulinum]EKO2043009.1 bifunctional adenosylcobinamide kinase/adenosylcobinamide-phosphate guanylyltransferase [Clostridium botulinum]MBO0525412.1 bifunctional adenosylcobinamide kinase/adenosylcobinamide-phosphate guanylyltransferase [Clostridium botulinum]MBO0529704.1 